MAFTVHDYHDLVKLLREHPEWQKELRQLLLPDELLALPEMVQQLVRAQQNAEERLSRLEAAVERLTEQVSALTEGQKRLAEGQERLIERGDTLEEGQERLEEGQKQLIKRVDTLEDGQKHIIERVDSLEDGQKHIIERVDSLEDGQKELRDDVGGLKGDMLEIRYRNRFGAYFGTRLDGPKVMELYMLLDVLEEALTPDEVEDLLLIDLVGAGNLRHVTDSPEIFLAMEISSVVDKSDVSRAVRRASLLRKAGYRAVPAVAGEDATQGADKAVREQSVLLVQNGRVEFWKEALANWEDIQLEED